MANPHYLAKNGGGEKNSCQAEEEEKARYRQGLECK
jgi:hypothetical protein